MSALKGRLAEALVESIFRQAGYTVSRIGRESQVQRLVMVGSDHFAPDFLVWKPLAGSSTPDLHQLLTVEVKYRRNLTAFLSLDAQELVDEARRRWPSLYLVVVTDDPAEGRSRFQAISVRDCTATAGPPTTVDLHQLRNLDIYRATVEEHENIARELFGVLPSGRRPARSATITRAKERDHRRA